MVLPTELEYGTLDIYSISSFVFGDMSADKLEMGSKTNRHRFNTNQVNSLEDR